MFRVRFNSFLQKWAIRTTKQTARKSSARKPHGYRPVPALPKVDRHAHSQVVFSATRPRNRPVLQDRLAFLELGRHGPSGGQRGLLVPGLTLRRHQLVRRVTIRPKGIGMARRIRGERA